MAIINNRKGCSFILIIITIISFLFSISVYSKQKGYVDEDKQQLMEVINESIIKSKFEINDIISNREEIYIDNKDIKILTMYNRNLQRSIFRFKKKTRFINSELQNGSQQLSDKHNYIEPINWEDIRLFYEQLSKEADNKEYVLLNDEEVYMFEEILKFYSIIRTDIDNLINRGVIEK